MLNFPIYDILPTKKLSKGIFSNILLIMISIFYVISLINSNFNIMYSLNTYFIFKWFEIYRLFTSIFLSESLILYILNIVSILVIINYYENTEATLFTIKTFFTQILFLQLIFICSNYILSFFSIGTYVLNICLLKYFTLSLLVKQMINSDGKYIFSYYFNKINTRFLLMTKILLIVLFSVEETIIITIINLSISIYFGFLTCKYEKFFSFEKFNLKLSNLEQISFLRNIDNFIHSNNIIKFKIQKITKAKALKKKISNEPVESQRLITSASASNEKMDKIEPTLDEKDEINYEIN